MGQRTAKFQSVTGGLMRTGKPATVAYSHVIRYFGFISHETDSVKTKHTHTFYFKLDTPITELGIRVFSPIPVDVFPNQGDIVSDAYLSVEKQDTLFFHPNMDLSLYSGSGNPENYTLNTDSLNWTVLASDDLTGKPHSKRDQSLIRLYDPKNPYTKNVKAGIYRINLIAIDPGGIFLMEIGSLSDFPVLKLIQ